MPNAVDLTVDVTDAAELDEPCHTAVTVFLPDEGQLSDPPVVCFAFPGGGYSRHYYSFAMPGAPEGGQAAWHTERGWIFVTCDHLGVGDSSLPGDLRLTYENIAAANAATVTSVLAQLAEGAVADGLGPVREPVVLGIGQSMGGCFLIVTQGRHQVFDGIGVLGYSAIHTSVPSRPGTPPVVWPWMPRNSDLTDPVLLNPAAVAAAEGPLVTDQEALEQAAAASGEHPFTWAFHYDDEPQDVVAEDMAAGAGGPLPRWRSATTPPCAIFMVAPGTVAQEAGAITVPVLVATGERDVVPDAHMEPKAYASSRDVTVFVCPRMAHMHNFAHTRERLWARLHSWGESIARPIG